MRVFAFVVLVFAVAAAGRLAGVFAVLLVAVLLAAALATGFAVARFVAVFAAVVFAVPVFVVVFAAGLVGFAELLLVFGRIRYRRFRHSESGGNLADALPCPLQLECLIASEDQFWDGRSAFPGAAPRQYRR